MAEKAKANKTGEKTTKASSPSKPAKTMTAGGKAGKSKKGGAAGKPKTSFNLEAPQAQEVCVAGSFNGWAPLPLRRNKVGIWSETVVLEPGEYEYRFVVDGVWWDDPANLMRRLNEFGTENCVVCVE